MINTFPRLQWRAIVVVALASASFACSQRPAFSPVIGPWQEEVALSDGRTVTVQRTMEFETRGSIGGPGEAYTKTATLRIIDPADGSALPTLSMPFRPLLLDFDTDSAEWVVIAFNDKVCWNNTKNPSVKYWDRGRNTHPDFEFRIVNGRWREVSNSPDLVGREANLIVVLEKVAEFTKAGRIISIDAKTTWPRPSEPNKSLRQVIADVRC